MANKRPNPNEAFPNPNLPRLCYIKNVVKNPRIIIGDYTYYDDVDGADQFEKHVTHFYDFIGTNSVPAGEATLSRCHLRNRKRFARSMIFGSINDL